MTNAASRIDRFRDLTWRAFNRPSPALQKQLDDLVMTASIFCRVSGAAISLLDSATQWFTAKVGIPIDSMSRNVSFCDYTVRENRPFIVLNAKSDLRFVDNPLVSNMYGCQFYAGFPVQGAAGEIVGALCIFDKSDRCLNLDEIIFLSTLSDQITLLVRSAVCEEMEGSFESDPLSKIGAITGTIVHELSNPLAVIGLRARHLTLMIEQPDLPTDKLQAAANSISDASQRMMNIVAGLSALARNEFDGVFETTSVNSLLNELVGSAVMDSAIEFEVVKLMDDAQIACRPDAIIEALLNIIQNAREAISASEVKWIRVSAKHADGGIEFSVADSGSGIPKEIVEMIPRPFFSTKKKSRESNAGVGLSISSKILKSHGGTIRVDSAAPNSTVICFVPDQRVRFPNKFERKAQV